MTSNKLIITLLTTLLFATSSFLSMAQESEQVRKFRRVMSLIDNFYVDTVNDDQLTEAAIKAMLKELDPHSVYMDKKEFKGMNEPLQGNFEGVGIQFNVLHDTIMVVSTISGGPSEKIGIMAGDRIVSINGENVAGIEISNSGVRKRLLGKKGTIVEVKIKRPGIERLLDYSIKRDKIPIYSLDAAYMANDVTGYIKLNRFAVTTFDEFVQALTDLQQQGMKHLILDLGNNGGGYLNIAIKLADEFLSDEKLIVYTEGINNPRVTHHATPKGNFEKGRLIVMINEGSASASEIVSGAIQDWDRGIIVGRRSFGKGLVQRQIELFDSTAMRLTIAHYYTPTGRSIQKPYNNGAEAYNNEINRRVANGELQEKDSINFPDSLKYETLSAKRIVYAGGGIMPDIFVPMDTSAYTDQYIDLVRKSVLNRTALTYLDKNRAIMKNNYPEFRAFKNNFQIDSALLGIMWDEAKKEGIEKIEDEYAIAEHHIKTQLKALIARDLYNNSEYFEIVNPLDAAYRQSLEIISNKKRYKQILK